MSARKALCILGAVLMLVSIFLPTLFWTMSGTYYGVKVSGSLYYWMWGYAFMQVSVEGGGVTMGASASHFSPDMLGILCMIIIIIGAILAMALGFGDSKAALVGGLLGIIGMVFFYVGVLIGLSLTPLGAAAGSGFVMAPFIGFFVCIVGGILALIGGALSS